MLVVADASVLVVAMADLSKERLEVQRWLLALTGGEDVYLLRNLTQLEFLSAARRLSLHGQLTEREAIVAGGAFIELPSHRLEVTRPMARRICEMRHNRTAYDAAYGSGSRVLGECARTAEGAYGIPMTPTGTLVSHSFV